MGISILVFSNNENVNVDKTIVRLKSAINELNLKNFEIILVDDGSTESLQLLAERHGLIFTRHPQRLGISDSILSGLKLASYDFIMPTPGHDMYSDIAFKNVLSLLGKSPLVIGCRVFTKGSRPPLKRLASRIFRDLYRHITFSFVGDVHGLVIYEREYLRKSVIQGGGHTFAMLTITRMLSDGCNLIQTLAPLNVNHRKRQDRYVLSQFPRPSQVLKTFLTLFVLRRYYLERQNH